MKREHSRSAAVLVLFVAAGCGKAPFEFAPVSGRVTLNGKPLANATVTFQPLVVGDDKTRPSDSFGKTDAEGRFSLAAVLPPGQRGAAVGQRRVWVRTAQQTELSDDLKKDVEKVIPQLLRCGHRRRAGPGEVPESSRPVPARRLLVVGCRRLAR